MTGDPGGGRSKRWLTLLVVVAAHAGILGVRFGWDGLTGPEPILQRDYAVHYANALDARAFLASLGRSWTYDPRVLAGWPAGVVFEVSNHPLATAVTVGGSWLGTGRAFNLGVFAALLCTPLCVGWAARTAGLGRPELAIAAAALFMHLDPLPRDVIRYGLVSFVLGSALAVAAAAAAARLTLDESRRNACALLACLALVLFVHVGAALVAGVPCVVAVAWAARRRRFSLVGLLAAAGLGGLALNALWLVRFAWFFDLGGRSTAFLQSSPSRLLLDFVWNSEMGPRAVIASLGVLGLTALPARPRLTLGSALAFAALVGYLGSRLPFFSGLEPGRFLISFGFAASALVPAGIARLAAPGLSGLGRWLPIAALAGVVVVPAALNRGYRFAASELLFDRFACGLTPAEQAIVDWVSGRAGWGRVLIEHPPSHGEGASWTELQALLPVLTGREIMAAPLPTLPLPHVSALLARGELDGRPIGDWSDAELEAYLERYGIHWVLVATRASRERFASFPGATRVAQPGGWEAFETDGKGPFVEGSGSVAARPGRLEVQVSRPGRHVLKYRCMRTLAVRGTGVRLSCADVGFDKVGFLALDVAPGAGPRFAIEDTGWSALWAGDGSAASPAP